ncbi:MAG: hypothetical protein LBE83_05985 [Propionibacteriaceae bacterium]|jgi:antitoxin (DNA-binding transcriptional repressor) of toxin-antitoxin stability system|nr:hypothetical protein [Propionibacteriaceae bacterium]
MRFISVRELRTSTAQVWQDLVQEGAIVVMNGSQPQALMVPVNGNNLEATAKAVRQAKATRALESMNTRAEAAGIAAMTMDEIDAEIALARRERSS